MKNIFYTFLCFAFLHYLNVLYSIISLFTSLLQHKISRSKPIARFLPGHVQPWKQGGTKHHLVRKVVKKISFQTKLNLEVGTRAPSGL